ncbi:hypothetical protein DICPUDRAFT_87259 [Dictyostelium purpureum]|uniref:Pescadillo homolog n=1 Tax=Dictyostelium purpureum TaxID=5786 RepID=F0ZGY9_DICPU|nr:uncharacterized protein DICPUDRAFT_87259 [Dictyostelium purpureum]EGC36815.1 hypothetical protein DICPUDRAFT_87259 [Dictyostelium purpureum]|eukprot:XP_003286686.1 hypothetical protein DICPUDRAFT_87259 [Dictyostelium purpureum]
MGGIRKFKKGVKGENLKFMTRNEAVKKLQVSLKVFRKLCILKGIHPRDPKKKLKGKNKTYYYAKDIKYLQNEKILETIRERKTIKEKEIKLIAKKEVALLKKLRENRPMISLDHIVKERYPTFEDALKDLDDCLSLIFLFANMDASPKIRENQIRACEKLAREFQYYVAKSNSLKKVFVSVKGIYYQAEIMGETITWITPLNYLSKKEKQVDYGVMISFIEFYQALMKFVNYRLFSSLDLEYPPKIDEIKLGKAEGLFNIFDSLKTKTAINAQKKIEAAKAVAAAAAALDGSKTAKADPKLKKLEEKISKISTKEEKSIKEPTESEEQNDLQVNASGISKDFEGLVDEENKDDIPKILDHSNLFKGFHFFLGREVPRHILEFIILSFGGRVSVQGGPVYEGNQTITHQIIDRNTITKTYHTREYIQPQWVFDSVNSKVLLPYSEYSIGVIPPAHLSPFVEYEDDDYIPARKAALDELINSKDFAKAIAQEEQEEEDEEEEEKDNEEESDDEDEENEDDAEILEQRYTEELRKEQDRKRKSRDDDEESEEEDEEDSDEEESEDEEMEQDKPVAANTTPAQMTKKQREDLKKQKQNEEELKLAETMIRKKERWIYNKIKETNQQKVAATQNLMDKRNKIESGKDVNGREKQSQPAKQQPTKQQPAKQQPAKQQPAKSKSSSASQPVVKKQKK